MGNQSWSDEELLRLSELRKKYGNQVKKIAEEMGKSVDSINKKNMRIDWVEFEKDPESYLDKEKDKQQSRFWTQQDMFQLDTYLQAGQSYHFISEKLGRGVSTVERKAQQTNWKAWRALVAEKGEEQNDNVTLKQEIVYSLLVYSRYDLKRLSEIKEVDFLNNVNLDKSKLPVSFLELKEDAVKELTTLGFKNPEDVDFESGTYVVVGDSHGKYTKNEMFDLLIQVNKFLKPKKIIHVGHLLDDDNDISYNWGKINNLVVLARVEELKTVQEQRNQGKFNYEVVRNSINFGELTVANQEMINDYVKTSISALGAELFEEERAIVNCHRLEFLSRCSYDTKSYLASPGALCEQHVIKTIKQIDFSDGKIVKQACWEGFSKYRRMKHMNRYWEQGLLVVNVNNEGQETVIPCPIKKIGKEYVIGYFDKIITSNGVKNPEEKIFVNADLHSDKHDCNVLDIQEQICKDYKPTKYVNLGDTHNYHSLNHHIMDRGGTIIDKRVIDEAAQTHHVLKRITNWCKDNYIICGNHERFAKDFVEKYPQFKGYLDFEFLCGMSKLNYKTTKQQDILTLGQSKFAHGEVRMYGQPGSKVEKASRTFGRDTFIGHIHYPSIRFGCFSVGLTGELDQEYNEPNASQWIHGFGLCNHYKGQSFMTTIAIVNNTCVINKKTYTPKTPTNWKIKNYKVRLDFETES